MTLFLSICGVILTLVAVGKALEYAYKHWIKPAVAACANINRLAPVVLTMAGQFEKNGGSSLRDTVERIASSADTAAATAEAAMHSATEAREAVKSLASDVAEVKSHLSRQDEMLRKVMPSDNAPRIQT